MFEHTPWRGTTIAFLFEATRILSLASLISERIKLWYYSPALNVVLEVIAPFELVFRLVLQFWNGLADDVR